MNFEEMTKTIFKNEKGKYSIGISNKKPDGTYDNAYLPIYFNNGVELENKTQIKIKKAWLTFYKWENEHGKGTTFAVRCSEFEEVDSPIKKVDIIDNLNTGFMKTESDLGTMIQITDEDLPF